MFTYMLCKYGFSPILHDRLVNYFHSNMKSLLKLQNTEDIISKISWEELLNDLPELLNVLAKICKENIRLMNQNYECEEEQHKLYTQGDGM